MKNQKIGTSLEDMTVKASVNVPVRICWIRHIRFPASGDSDSEENFVEYSMQDKSWLPDNVRMTFNGMIKQYISNDEYKNLISKRQEHKSVYGKISFELTPLIDAQEDRFDSYFDRSDSNLTQVVQLNVPVSINHDEKEIFGMEGNKDSKNSYWVEFLVHSLNQKMPTNIENLFFQNIDLILSEEQYVTLAEKREKQKNAFGRITVKLKPLIEQK